MSYFLGNFSEMVIEFGFVATAMGFFAGPIYLLNMLLTLGLYTKFTRRIGAKRMKLIKERRDIDRKQIFFQGNSMLNVETVKNYSTENLEKKRYREILSTYRKKTVAS